jgi:hypothetical protein
MAEGTVSVIAGLGIALFTTGRHREHELFMAGGLALAACKPHLAVVPVVLLVAERRWATLVRTAAAVAAVAAPSLVTPGARAWLSYPSALLGAGGPESAAADYSDHWWNIAALLHRSALSPSVVSALSWVLFGAGVAGLVAMHRHHPDRVPLTSVLLVGLVLTPHANPHDAIWVPLAYVLVRQGEGWWRRPTACRAGLDAVALLWPIIGLLAMAYADRGGSALAVGWLIFFALLSAGPSGWHRLDHHRTAPDVIGARHG